MRVGKIKQQCLFKRKTSEIVFSRTLVVLCSKSRESTAILVLREKVLLEKVLLLFLYQSTNKYLFLVTSDK